MLLHGESLLLETDREQLGVTVCIRLVASQLNLHRFDVELQPEIDGGERFVCILNGQLLLLQGLFFFSLFLYRLVIFTFLECAKLLDLALQLLLDQALNLRIGVQMPHELSPEVQKRCSVPHVSLKIQLGRLRAQVFKSENCLEVWDHLRQTDNNVAALLNREVVNDDLAAEVLLHLGIVKVMEV